MKRPLKNKEPAFSLRWEEASKELWRAWSALLRQEMSRCLPPVTEGNHPLACDNRYCHREITYGSRVIVERASFDKKHVEVFCSVSCQREDVLAMIRDMREVRPDGPDPRNDFEEVDIGE